MKKVVIILRSVSGAGKSTLADILCQQNGWLYLEADHYFYKNGKYEFDQSKLPAAHARCQNDFVDALSVPSIEGIVISNTNTTEKEIEFYQTEAAKIGATFISLVVENRHGGKNQHSVPNHILQKQKNNILNSLTL